MLVEIDSLADTEQYAGKLKGKFVMLSPVPELESPISRRTPSG